MKKQRILNHSVYDYIWKVILVLSIIDVFMIDKTNQNRKENTKHGV